MRVNTVGSRSVTSMFLLFARRGLDVSVQYGADQPEYDLIVAKSEKMLKFSVNSKDSAGLTQSFLKEAKYHEAIDVWLRRHTKKTIFRFIQSKGVPVGGLPRVYLASTEESLIACAPRRRGQATQSCMRSMSRAIERTPRVL